MFEEDGGEVIVWKVKAKGYNVIWKSFTWAIADWLDLRTQDVGWVFIYPKIVGQKKFASMKESSGM